MVRPGTVVVGCGLVLVTAALIRRLLFDRETALNTLVSVKKDVEASSAAHDAAISRLRQQLAADVQVTAARPAATGAPAAAPPPALPSVAVSGKDGATAESVGVQATQRQCNASDLPRWSVESKSHTGVDWHDRSQDVWKPPCPEGHVPDSLKLYSQYGQEARLIERYFWGVHGGVFIELGAHDGLRMSNTKTLEDFLGWTGLLIEANPSMYSQVRRTRPRSTVAHAACGSSWQKDGIHLVLGGGGETSHLRGLSATAGQAKKQHGVAVSPMATIAALTERLRCGRPLHVDFMSLDVEGAELMVLQGFDWENVTVGIMLIETAWLNQQTQDAMDKLLLEKGSLKRMLTEGGDTWYISPHGASRRRAKPSSVSGSFAHVPMGGVVRPKVCPSKTGKRGKKPGRFVVCWKEAWARPQYGKCLG